MSDARDVLAGDNSGTAAPSMLETILTTKVYPSSTRQCTGHWHQMTAGDFFATIFFELTVSNGRFLIVIKGPAKPAADVERQSRKPAGMHRELFNLIGGRSDASPHFFYCSLHFYIVICYYDYYPFFD